MKKLLIIFILFSFIGLLLTPNLNLEAKTLGEIKKEAENLEKKLEQNKTKTAQTKEEKANTEAKVNKIKSNIEQANRDIDSLSSDIEENDKAIKEKEKEIAELMSFVQITNGESSYLEFIFGSKTFEDLIYRMAIAEQLSKHNDELVDEYNAAIEENKVKTKELKNKQTELGEQQQQLELEVAKLGEEIEKLDEGRLDLSTELKSQQDVIALYKSFGCSDEDDISGSCGMNRLEQASGGSGGIASSSSFLRPITSGYVTSNYGWRFHPTLGYSRLHNGIDVSTSGSAVPVYPTASGMVVNIVRKSSCGGNMVYIHHRINGKNYTSVYMHLRNIYVSPGQSVTANTQIATMGGDPSIEYWDGCSTGQHLHFTLANGLYFKEYSSYDTFQSKTFDPRNKVNFPAVNGWFSGR